jgi:predicted phage terminase large subunit-like protein
MTRAKPMSSAAEHGLVKMVRGPWNRGTLAQAQAFGSGKGHDDEVDAMVGAFNRLQESEFAWVTVKR